MESKEGVVGKIAVYDEDDEDNPMDKKMKAKGKKSFLAFFLWQSFIVHCSAHLLYSWCFFWRPEIAQGVNSDQPTVSAHGEDDRITTADVQLDNLSLPMADEGQQPKETGQQLNEVGN